MSDDMRRKGEPREQYLEEGDEVWVRGKVFRGSTDRYLVEINGFVNKEPDFECFTAVFPDTELRGNWRERP